MALTKIPSELSSTTGIVDNSNATAITIDSNENVGIGTTSPSTKLTVSGSVRALRSDDATQYGDFAQDSSGGYISTHRPHASLYENFRFLASNNSGSVERMRIDSSGNLLVGATSNALGTTGFKINPVGFARIERSGTGANTHLTFANGNGDVGSVTTGGSTTYFNTSSDYRLKENVVELTGATERLKQLNPTRFNFIADADTTVDGFLAHEVADVVPEAISGEKDAVDADGNPEYQGIDQSKLVPLLVATIQELEARITELENN